RSHGSRRPDHGDVPRQGRRHRARHHSARDPRPDDGRHDRRDCIGGGGMSVTENRPSRWHQAFRAITTGNGLIAVLSVVLALIAGSILIAVTDDGVQAAASYFFARPGDTFVAMWEAASGAYIALFQGAIYNTNA